MSKCNKREGARWEGEKGEKGEGKRKSVNVTRRWEGERGGERVKERGSK